MYLNEVEALEAPQRGFLQLSSLGLHVFPIFTVASNLTAPNIPYMTKLAVSSMLFFCFCCLKVAGKQLTTAATF